MPELFDTSLRAMRRDRAARMGAELFLFERVFDDCLERIALMNRRFERALLIGCPDPTWPGRLREVADAADVHDPGPLFADRAGGCDIIEDRWNPEPGSYDVAVAIGTLDTVNELPIALRLIGHAMRPGSLFIGAVAGGDTLPRMRSAMRAADALGGGATAHVHPRIEPAALAPLLESAGFVKPVVDVDRVQLSYSSIHKLVADLRRMGATNVLLSRSAPLSRVQVRAAERAFGEAGDGERTQEIIEILNFAAWTPEQD